jgi:hypothetical protein
MAAVLGVNVYNSVVDARSWGAIIPESIVTARGYFKVVNPGTFFRVASPLNQLLALAALVVCWKAGRRARVWFALALAATVAAEVLTFAFFFPRNQILFLAGDLDAEVLKAAWSQWSGMNWARSLLLALGLACEMKGLDSLYTIEPAGAAQRDAATAD